MTISAQNPSETPVDGGASPTALRAFEQSLPMALLRAREAAMRQFRPILKKQDLTDQQWRVLRALTTENRPMTVGELVSATFLLGPSLTRILGKLVERGLIDRTVPEHDHRQGVISLTTAGIDMVARVAPHSEAAYGALEEHFGPEKMIELMELLHELAALGTPEGAAAVEATAKAREDGMTR